MESYRHFLDPNDMTPEERLERIIELLATASVRLAEEEAGQGAMAAPPVGRKALILRGSRCNVPPDRPVSVGETP